MSKEEMLDLTDLAGYERLYQTLLRDGEIEPRRLRWMMYDWYCANMVGYNEGANEKLKPIDSVAFEWRMEKSQAPAYKTDVQLNKALILLIWNVADKEPFIESNQRLYELHEQYAQAFRMQYGYGVTDRITSFALCEDILNPVHEPATEFNPSSMQRLEDSHPQLVYICASLRGDVPANIEFARQKAQEVFVAGDIPVCPHLMFPPIADPGNPDQDKKAMEMCLKMMERCHKVHVYGPEWTEGMCQEIHHAEWLKIPIHTDQKEIGRPSPKKNRGPCR